MSESFEFLVFDFAVPVEPLEDDPDFHPESLPQALRARFRRETVTPEQLEEFWKKKVIGLTNTISEAQKAQQPKGFYVDEISFALAVGAKGGIAFVAEGSVQATITVKLRQPPPR